MKKILFTILFALVLSGGASANINVFNFKKDLEKLSLEKKAFFCFPVLEYAQYDYIRIIKFIEENENIKDDEKRTEIQKIITAFKGVFYYQTIISYYWFEDNDYKFPEKPSKEYVNKLLKGNEISKKSEEYLGQISTKEFTDNKIVTTCFKALEPFFTQNVKVKAIIKDLKENEKSLDDQGLKRIYEIANELN